MKKIDRKIEATALCVVWDDWACYKLRKGNRAGGMIE